MGWLRGLFICKLCQENYYIKLDELLASYKTNSFNRKPLENLKEFQKKLHALQKKYGKPYILLLERN